MTHYKFMRLTMSDPTTHDQNGRNDKKVLHQFILDDYREIDNWNSIIRLSYKPLSTPLTSINGVGCQMFRANFPSGPRAEDIYVLWFCILLPIIPVGFRIANSIDNRNFFIKGAISIVDLIKIIGLRRVFKIITEQYILSITIMVIIISIICAIDFLSR